ncbi:exopolysaccharide biosynthesis protein [Paracoccus sp. S1E-3]|nr:exopolysaccharide biosynthesis protein [Paracoccus sp. S1E-3]
MHSSDPVAGPETGGDGGGDPNGLQRKRPPPRKRLSQILAEIAEDDSRSEITIADLMHLMEGRARAALIFLFAMPNVLPAPPGLSGLLGLPLLYLTWQMMLGRVPWLPRIIAGRGFPHATFAALIQRVSPFLIRAEKLLRPRWNWLVGPRAEHLLGALMLVLAVVVTLPIPFGNMLPAFAICLIALGVLERDGLWACLGVFVGVVALLLSATVVYAMVKGALFVLLGAFS